MPLSPDPATPVLEGWTTLSALAARTERLRFGLIVAANLHRLPATLGKMAATLDVVSGGRLVFGFGAGGAPRDCASYGVPDVPPAERIARLREACEIIKRMWTEPVFDYAGRYYQLEQTRCEPKPIQRPHPPIMIGGVGERLLLRVVAEHADLWNMPGHPHHSVEEFARKSRILAEHCAAVGRDPATITRSVQVVVDRAKPAVMREILRGLIAAGASHLVLAIPPPYEVGMVRRITDELIVPLAAEADPA
jgi:alkanesulfonate monooxygenase SsuD/methylene tetrahydromethanopterin reductase-like flavin-dependent oxidoreductase (luciferase family)